VDLFITPSIIQQFYLKPEWGLQAYYSTVHGIKKADNFFTRRGVNLHNKLGFDNDRRFFGTKILRIDGEDYVVALEGTPDALNPLKELKTCGNKTPEQLEDNIQAASLQLMGYMFLTGDEVGYVVFVNRKTEEKITEVEVYRDDKKFFAWVKKFFQHLWSQPTLQDYTSDHKTFKPADKRERHGVGNTGYGKSGHGNDNEGVV